MAHVPLRLARDIDRLALHAHRFHRFAHHPLCREYDGELLRVGRRTRVCRGCVYTAIGCACGLVACAALPMTVGRGPALAGLAALLAAAGAGVAAAAALLAGPRDGAQQPLAGARCTSTPGARPSKLWTRLLPAAALTFALGAAFRVGGLDGALCGSLVLAASVALRAAYRRRGPNRSPCAGCPERLQSAVCRGYAPIVRRERALQRVAGRWIAAAGPARRPTT